MARELEASDYAKIVGSLFIPGVGHLVSGHAGIGVGFFAVAVVVVVVTSGFGLFVVGIAAAAHLFMLLTKDPPEQLPSIDFKSLPKKETAAPAAVLPTDEVPAPAVEVAPAPTPAVKEPTVEKQPDPVVEVAQPAGDDSSPDIVLPATSKTPTDGGFVRTESKSRIPAFNLGVGLGEASEAEPNWPEVLPYLLKRVDELESTMRAAKDFHAVHKKTWTSTAPALPEKTPVLLRNIAEKLGGVHFEAGWSHTWPFKAGQTISLFEQLVRDPNGWQFAHDKNDPSALSLLWVPSGEVIRRSGSTESVVAADFVKFIDVLSEGFRIAQASRATQAVMSAEHLLVLPADEVEQGTPDAMFPDFWMGASGPGLSNIGWSFEPPYIRNPKGARMADMKDVALIETFHEWLTSDPESPEGAMEVAKLAENDVRPVGKVLLDGEVVVAWWGESPPLEVDAFVDHMRGLMYAKS